MFAKSGTYGQAVTNQAVIYQTKETTGTKTIPYSSEANFILRELYFQHTNMDVLPSSTWCFSSVSPSALLPSSHLFCSPLSDLLPVLPLDAVTVVSTQAAVWQSDSSWIQTFRPVQWPRLNLFSVFLNGSTCVNGTGFVTFLSMSFSVLVRKSNITPHRVYERKSFCAHHSTIIVLYMGSVLYLQGYSLVSWNFGSKRLSFQEKEWVQTGLFVDLWLILLISLIYCCSHHIFPGSKKTESLQTKMATDQSHHLMRCRTSVRAAAAFSVVLASRSHPVCQLFISQLLY